MSDARSEIPYKMHTVTNLGESCIWVRCRSGRTFELAPQQSIDVVLETIHHGKARARYKVEPLGDGEAAKDGT